MPLAVQRALHVEEASLREVCHVVIGWGTKSVLGYGSF